MSFLVFAAKNVSSPCFFSLVLQPLLLFLPFGETFVISTSESRRLCKEGSTVSFKTFK